MHSRFYAPDLQPGAATVRLPIEEGRHLVRVMRLRLGDPVRVFDGKGLECAGRVEAIDRDEVSIGIEGEAAATPEPRTVITLAQAVLKGDCMDGVVRDSVMLGVRALVPILTAHVEGDRRSHAAGLRLPRWERITISSAKQCGRAVVPAIAPPMSLARCLAEFPAEVRIALVEPTPLLPPAGLRSVAGEAVPASALLLVGPEGGWEEDELRLLAGYGALRLTLGARVLRAESAAIVGLSALHTLWGEFA